MTKIRIYLADDHALIGDALKNLLESERLTVVGHALDGKTALNGVRELQPDIVVMDIGMPIMNGLTVTERIKAEFPQMKVIMLSMNIDPDIIVEALGLGADAFVSKTSVASSLLEAIDAVIEGRRYTSPEFEGLILERGLLIEDQTLEDILDRALAEIVGGFCHDIGNDLQVCLLLLKDRKYGKAQKFGSNAERSLRGLHQFVRQFYAGGGFDLSTVRGASIETVVRGICRHVLRDQKIPVHIESSGFDEGHSVPSILLRHLITPLVHNSAEAITSAKPDKAGMWLTLSVEKPMKVLRISVEDNGIGWNGREEMIEKALKTGQAVSTKKSDRGFGLQNIWRLLKRVGGDIRLSERPNGGAQVEIWFEMRHADRESVKDQSPAPDLKPSKRNLTPRQKEVLRLLAEGRSMKEVAVILHLSPRTVAFHKYTMMEQLKLRSGSELVQYALKNLTAA